jgi:uncharacterized protein (TIGR01244 family)
MSGRILASVPFANGLVACAKSSEPMSLSKQQFSIADGVVLAGVLNLETVSRLPAQDTVVVELRTTAEGVAAEAELMVEKGFEYHHIPVSGAEIVPAQLAQLNEIAQNSHGKTLIVHCRSANRAAMLWGAHLLEQGQTLEQVLRAVGPALTGKDNRQALLTFATEHNAAHSK